MLILNANYYLAAKCKYLAKIENIFQHKSSDVFKGNLNFLARKAGVSL